MFFQMRIITNATGAGGEWSDPEPLLLEFPLPRKHIIITVLTCINQLFYKVVASISSKLTWSKNPLLPSSSHGNTTLMAPKIAEVRIPLVNAR